MTIACPQKYVSVCVRACVHTYPVFIEFYENRYQIQSLQIIQFFVDLDV